MVTDLSRSVLILNSGNGQRYKENNQISKKKIPKSVFPQLEFSIQLGSFLWFVECFKFKTTTARTHSKKYLLCVYVACVVVFVIVFEGVV